MGDRPKTNIWVGTTERLDEILEVQGEIQQVLDKLAEPVVMFFETFEGNMGDELEGIGVSLFSSDWDSSPDEIDLCSLFNKGTEIKYLLSLVLRGLGFNIPISTYVTTDYT